jgi:hypothetical protein
VVSFGWRYDFNERGMEPTDPPPPWLDAVRARAAAFAGVEREALEHVLLTEYAPGAPIGWHRDRPEFDKVVGVSLGSPCTFRMRRKQGAKWERYSLSPSRGRSTCWTGRRGASGSTASRRWSSCVTRSPSAPCGVEAGGAFSPASGGELQDRLMLRAPVLLLPIALAALAGAAEAQPQRTPDSPSRASAQRARLTPAELKEIEDQLARGGVDSDAAMYARSVGVSLTEAKRRMAIQARDDVRPRSEPGPRPPPPPDSVGRISALLEGKESATFAGMWWQHEPEYRMVVAFTRDAAATLAKYTRDPIYKAVTRPGPTQAELRATQERLFRDLGRYGVQVVSASADIRDATVEIEVVSDLAPARAAAARGELQIPAYVRFREPPPIPRAAPPLPPAAQNPVKGFPRSTFRSGGPQLAILRVGKAVLEDGCLRLVGAPGRRNRVIVWPNEAALDLVSEPGAIRVFDRMSGQSMRIGETMVLGGNSADLEGEKDVQDASPACPGPYTRLSGFGPYAEVEQGSLEREAQELAAREKIALAAARDRIRADKAREVRLRALGEQLLQTAPETFADISVWNGRATLGFTRDPVAELRRLVPADLQPFVKAELRPAPLARLRADEARINAEFEAAGPRGGAAIEAHNGRIAVSTEDVPALSRAVLGGKVRLPADSILVTSGQAGSGEYSEARMEAAHRRLEAAPDFAAVRAQVEATRLPAIHVGQREGGPEGTPSRRQSLDLARFMVAYGFTAEKIRKLKAHGVDPVRALVLRNGADTIEGRAIISEEVVVAEAVDADPRAAALRDGGRSTVRFWVVEPLKGRLRAGEVATVRLGSGFAEDGGYGQATGEPVLLPGLPTSLKIGGRYLLFLSSSLYANQAMHVGGRPMSPGSERWFVPTREISTVEGERIGATYSEPALSDLVDLRRRLKPIAAAFEAAR